MTSKTLTTALAALVLTGAAAGPAAARTTGADARPAGESARITAEAAMRKGIRDFGRVAGDGARASRFRIDCVAVPDVGDEGRCRGTFRLTRGGRSATYALTSRARVLRISPGAIEYRVGAQQRRRVRGLPYETRGFSGFLQ
jgi:hypothetical protein